MQCMQYLLGVKLDKHNGVFSFPLALEPYENRRSDTDQQEGALT